MEQTWESTGNGELVHDRETLEARQTAIGSLPAALTASFGVVPAVLRSLGIGHGLQLALRPQGYSGPVASVDLSRAMDRKVTEWHAGLAAGYLWPTNTGKIQGWFGGQVGGGFIRQSINDTPDRKVAS